MAVLKAQPRQHISNIYIYLYVSDPTVYAGSENIIVYWVSEHNFCDFSPLVLIFVNQNFQKMVINDEIMEIKSKDI